VEHRSKEEGGSRSRGGARERAAWHCAASAAAGAHRAPQVLAFGSSPAADGGPGFNIYRVAELLHKAGYHWASCQVGARSRCRSARPHIHATPDSLR
jgi:hypothetical protein